MDVITRLAGRGLSQPGFQGLYKTTYEKVAAVLISWGLADPNKFEEVRHLNGSAALGYTTVKPAVGVAVGSGSKHKARQVDSRKAPASASYGITETAFARCVEDFGLVPMLATKKQAVSLFRQMVQGRSDVVEGGEGNTTGLFGPGPVSPGVAAGNESAQIQAMSSPMNATQQGTVPASPGGEEVTGSAFGSPRHGSMMVTGRSLRMQAEAEKARGKTKYAAMEKLSGEVGMLPWRSSGVTAVSMPIRLLVYCPPPSILVLVCLLTHPLTCVLLSGEHHRLYAARGRDH